MNKINRCAVGAFTLERVNFTQYSIAGKCDSESTNPTKSEETKVVTLEKKRSSEKLLCGPREKIETSV